MILLLLLCGLSAQCQTTQGLISGRAVDSISGQPVSGAQISWSKIAVAPGGSGIADASGYFNLPLLSPGLYRLRIDAPGYQGQELYQIDLPVSGRLDFEFRLRPLSDLWEAGQFRSVFFPNSRSVLTFYGPDVDTTHTEEFDSTESQRTALEASVSQVIDSVELRDLPLNGRDVYALLVTQPGVTSDASTGRGLGLSINGQRPTSSNFLMDGVENNNYLITGPLVTVAPEAIEEYRLSTSNFTAEFGRTSGVLANAVTRSGSDQWHGLGYYYLKNDLLNANGFQQNLEGFHTPLKQSEPGFFVGGPIRRNSLFISVAFDYERFRSESDPQEFLLPTPQFAQMSPAGSAARQLLQMFPLPIAANAPGPSVDLNIAPPVSIDQLLALPRVDYLRRGGADRFFARLALSRVDQPDFYWTPYPEFTTPLHQDDTGLAAGWIGELTASSSNEARFAWSTDNLVFNRQHPEIPSFSVGCPVTGPGADPSVCPVPGLDLTLPGSPLFYSYQNRSHDLEFNDNLVHEHGRHVFKLGAGVLLRHLDGYLTAGRDGLFEFDNPQQFLADTPSEFQIAQTRGQPNRAIPQYNREYSYNQFCAFAQDSFKVTPRLVLNYGLRYENFGAPSNVGPVKDALVLLGNGGSFAQRLANASLPPAPGGGDQQLYDSDNRDFSFRTGFAYSLRNNARTLLRGGFGTYYDPPFDNLWQTLRNNGVVLASASNFSAPINFLQPVATTAASLPALVPGNFPTPTFFQPGLRNGYAENFFLGIQQQWTEKFTLEVNGLGSLGRELLTTDVVNRLCSLPCTPQDPTGLLNAALPSLAYRANQGLSDYYALTAVARYRAPHSLVQASYTWSKTVDNQSDPLLGDFFDLSFTAATAVTNSANQAAFQTQFDSRADRGLADFDQRQNFVFFWIEDLPPGFVSTTMAPLFRNWKIAGLGAVRSGFPYSVRVIAQPPPFQGGGLLLDNRANLVDPTDVYTSAPAAGGKLLLNPNAFGVPAFGQTGNTGRNEFEGPGLYSLDVSLSRAFPVRRLGELGKLVLRADAFNVLNHANLNNPNNVFGSSQFGLATYGRLGQQTGFPAAIPFNETPRQLQLMLRLEF